MRSIASLLLCIAIASVAAHAESFNRRLARGQALLKTGDVDEAITIFRDLQVDAPESETLHFDLGCAHYAKALRAAGDNALPEAADALKKAAESFEDASMTPDARLRQDAQFNRATSFAQLAKQSAGGADPEAAIASFEQAIAALEDFIRQYPEHAEAQTNLNNVRYELKKFLQQTPPPSEQSESDGSEGKGEESDKEKQESPQEQNQEEGEQENEEQQPSQGDQQQDDQSEEQQQSEQEQEENQEQPQTDENSKEQQDPQQQPAESTPQDEQSETTSQEIAENSENIEAILESLQDMDERQQHEMRQQPRRMNIRSKWW